MGLYDVCTNIHPSYPMTFLLTLSDFMCVVDIHYHTLVPMGWCVLFPLHVEIDLVRVKYRTVYYFYFLSIGNFKLSGKRERKLKGAEKKAKR